jgi:hypothetical protein
MLPLHVAKNQWHFCHWMGQGLGLIQGRTCLYLGEQCANYNMLLDSSKMTMQGSIVTNSKNQTHTSYKGKHE